jgi:putative membrane protein
MADDTERQGELDPRIYFAAERTLLAWVRTGLALMGFGFVVARFGLFLREVAAVRDVSSQHGTGFSMWVGTALVILGVGVNVAAVVGHWRRLRRLERGQRLRFKPWSLGTVVPSLLGLLGLVTAAYLLVGLGR